MERSFLVDKIKAAWVGKSLAGAIGMPYEGVPYTLDLDENEIIVSNVPNDDLELQLVWLEALKEHGLELSCRHLGEVWQKRIAHGCDEYSIAIYNMAHGIYPPASGWKNNYFADGMGAAIRSEIWALVFAGNPDAAAYYASQDAEVDHWGDGVRAEMFMARAEARVCECSDIPEALHYALAHCDRESRLYHTLKKVVERYDSGMSEAEARRELLLTEQRNNNFTDCVMNLSFIVHALLYGNGDFIRTVIYTVNFGRDTDCTAASCGAFLGAAKGMKVFPAKWLEKVSDDLILSDFVALIPGVPRTIDEMSDVTLELHDRFAADVKNRTFPDYRPYEPDGELPEPYRSKWLVINDGECDIAGLKEQIAGSGRCPEEFAGRIVEFTTPYMDLSPWINPGASRLHLISLLEVADDVAVDPGEMIFMGCADVGLRIWMDKRRILNNHSRNRMIPAMHRTQGGAAFSLPVEPGRRYLFHVELFHCLKNVGCTLLFGNTSNDLLDGFEFKLEK